MAKSLAQIRAEHQYIDKEGVTRDRTLNIPHYFKEIPFIYSPLLEKGRVKFSASMQKLYCYVADWEKSGGVCYEEQSELAKVCRLSRPKTNDLIEQMELIGLITRTKIEGRRNKELRALPLTDAHITSPEALTAQPIALSDEMPTQPAPEPAKAAEETQDDAPDWDAPVQTLSTQHDKPELPWGGVAVFKPNGEPVDAALKWALTDTMDDEEEAYRLISLTASKHLGREIIFTVPTNETFDDFEGIPF
ncbi:MarR family transcriptional regulator [Cronobacter sakazakii]|nr:MarR family transcriptional regulator [Cronobacter sakazakii]ELQ6210818.1 MarR family transcriptional regulator [Cronobacter sakazakii]ELY3463904.1 MarR family transcriptional regulator [Cronobacter sakazakii]